MVNKKVQETTRRSFLVRMWQALGVVVLVQACVGAFYYLATGRKRDNTPPPAPINVGNINDFPLGSVTLISTGNIYLSRLEDGGFLAISRKCTHLGCIVPWVAERKQFECPCHASIFDHTGNVRKSPAPRALDLYPISFDHETILIDISHQKKRSSFKAEQVTYVKEQG